MTELPRYDLQSRLAGYGAALDADIARSGAADRVRRNVLRHRATLAGISWQRVAAAVLVAGMLGGAVDFVFSERAADPFDVALVDPLYGLEGADGP